MRESPHPKLLHRELSIHDVKATYSRQVEFLQDLVNYGTNLIVACLETSKKGLADIVIITVLFKQVVRMLDSFEVLLSNGCGPSSVLPVRSAFEASLAIDWMLKSGKGEKAVYYYVSNLRRQRTWTRRTIAGDEERDRFFSGLGEFAVHLTHIVDEDALSQLRTIDDLLTEEPYKTASDALDKAQGRREHEPPWYVPLGLTSVRMLSKEVGRVHEYDLVYTQMSETMHTSWYGDHILVQDGYISLEPLRHLEKVALFISYAASVALHTYRMILSEYRPGQIREFAQRYSSDWRQAFLNIPDIKHSVQASGPTI